MNTSARRHDMEALFRFPEANPAVPWIGFPVGYSVSGVLLTVFCYIAMVLS